jgi:hypothetical protein
MKNIRNNTLILLMLLITSSIFAQFGGMTGALMPQVVVAKVKLVSGDLSQIKGKKLKLQLTFDGMLVSKYKMMFGKKISEDEFIKNKSADLNEKEAGKGDEWASKWKSDKENRYVPSFITKFNELSNEFGTTISSTEGDITVIVHTSYTEPGYFIGIDKAPAIIATDITFKDANGTTLAVVTIENCAGQAFGFGDTDTGARMGEAYEKLAKELAQLCIKKGGWKK